LLKLRSWKVEFVLVTTDPSCGWVMGEENEYAFFNERIRPKNPILNFTFINHLSRTVVLKSVIVRRRSLWSGMAGPAPEPEILYPMAKYHIPLYGREAYSLQLESPIAVPTQRAFLFQVELSEGVIENISRPFRGRKATQFTFNFSNGITVNAPIILFNCNSENENITIELKG
jgi:hypothetical protein